MVEEKYNGWTNYETWLMNLNLTNEEDLYNEIHEMAKEEKDDYQLAENLKNFVEENFTIEEHDIIKLCDVWTYRDFQEINWCEIAQSLREE